MKESNRPLFIDFESYTEGDAAFKTELITLIITNLQDLQEALINSHTQNNKTIFQSTSHKVKPSIIMLDDLEFTAMVDILNENTFESDTSASFKKICNDIIKSLQKETLL